MLICKGNNKTYYIKEKQTIGTLNLKDSLHSQQSTNIKIFFCK